MCVHADWENAEAIVDGSPLFVATYPGNTDRIALAKGHINWEADGAPYEVDPDEARWDTGIGLNKEEARALRDRLDLFLGAPALV